MEDCKRIQFNLKSHSMQNDFAYLQNSEFIVQTRFYSNAAPKTPAESPNLFFRIGVSTKSEKTL